MTKIFPFLRHKNGSPYSNPLHLSLAPQASSRKEARVEGQGTRGAGGAEGARGASRGTGERGGRGGRGGARGARGARAEAGVWACIEIH